MYTNKRQHEKEILKTVAFMVASRKMKYLGINPALKVNDLYKENYSSLKKEIEEIVVLCCWIGRTHIVKMAIVPKLYRFSAALIKIPTVYFTDV